MYAALILGAGPGGTGPLIWAAQQGRLEAWLEDGIALVDRAPTIGGTLGRYLINSDSLGGAYLECLEAPGAQGLLGPLLETPVARELARLRNGFPPLGLVGSYLEALGEVLEETFARSRNSAFRGGVEVRSLHLRDDGTVAVETVQQASGTRWIEARAAVMALGGRPVALDWPDMEFAPSLSLADIDPEKLILSDRLFTADGLAEAMAKLDRARFPHVVILGGRHSAFSSAWLLTQRGAERFSLPAQITILCRRVAPVFYANREEALADGVSISDRDICPRTGRVHRFSGMRGDGRDLWRRITHRPGAEKEERIAIARVSDPAMTSAALRQLLDRATLVVAAFGYRAATVPVFDAAGRRLALSADCGGPAVGPDARLLLQDGSTLANLFGIGLGTGFRPWGAMGGEASLEGQTNSLWLYQNHIGKLVYEGVRAASRTPISATAQQRCGGARA